MRRAYERSGIAPKSIQFVEAHGTATPKGDDTELESLAAVFADRATPLLIGSLKAQTGHTGWAAGTASIIKLCLALGHRLLPKQHNFSEPSAALAAQGQLLDVVHTECEWPSNGSLPRRAATSGFGFGGTNAHVIVEEFVPAFHRSFVRRAPLTKHERLAVVAVETLSSTTDVSLPADIRLLPDLVESLDRGQLLALRLAHPIAALLPKAIRPEVAVVLSVPDKAQLGREVQLHIYRERLLRVAAEKSLTIAPALAEARAKVPLAGPYTLQGMMQNVVSGRVANIFDLHGPNFTVDGGRAGLAEALDLAPLLLNMGTKVALIGALELGEQAPGGREGALAMGVCTPETAAELGLPVRAIVRFDQEATGADLDIAALTKAFASAAHGDATRFAGGFVVEGEQPKGFNRAPIARYTPMLVAPAKRRSQHHSAS
jgi:hypothetical protein